MKPALVLGLALAASAFSTDSYDNELIIAPTDQFGNIKQYPRNIRFDEDSNELFTFRTPRYRNLTNRFPGIFLDDEADDELMMAPYRRRFEDGEGRRIYNDEADNEQFVGAHGRLAHPKKSHPGLAQFTKRHPGVVLNNQDDELPLLMNSKLFVERQRKAEALRRDDDDELLVRQTSSQFVDDELIKAPKTKHKGNTIVIQQNDDEFLVRPAVPFVAADDELHSGGPHMSSRLFVEKQRQAEALRRDDEVDDELVYLSELLKKAPFDGAVFRVLDDDDDEFRIEKGVQMKDNELLEIRGKVRPFLPFS